MIVAVAPLRKRRILPTMTVTDVSQAPGGRVVRAQQTWRTDDAVMPTIALVTKEGQDRRWQDGDVGILMERAS